MPGGNNKMSLEEILHSIKGEVHPEMKLSSVLQQNNIAVFTLNN